MGQSLCMATFLSPLCTLVAPLCSKKNGQLPRESDHSTLTFANREIGQSPTDIRLCGTCKEYCGRKAKQSVAEFLALARINYSLSL